MGGGNLRMARFFGKFASLLVCMVLQSIDDDIGSVNDKLNNLGGFKLFIEVLDLIKIDFPFKLVFLDFEHEHVIWCLDKACLVLNFAFQAIAIYDIQLKLAPLAEMALFCV